MVKRIFKVLLMTIIIFSQIQFVPLLAEGDQPFSGGSGTAEDPYLISCAEDLLALSADTCSSDSKYEKKSFLQTCDIELNPEDVFTPISNAQSFRGTYDGGGYTIDGINAVSKFACALISNASDGAIIKNVVIGPNCTFEHTSQANMLGYNSVGSIVGFVANGKTIIDNCVSFATLKTTNPNPKMGGIVGNAAPNGHSRTLTITNCYFGGKCVYEGTASGGYDVAGILGNNNLTTTINNCINAGTIEGGAIKEVGGIAGYISGGKTSSLTNCINVGEVSSSNDSLGGILGEGSKALTFKNNLNLGTVKGADGKKVGSLIGNYGPNSSTVSSDNFYDGFMSPKLTAIGSQTGTVAGMKDASNFGNVPTYDGTARNFDNAVEIAAQFKTVYEGIKALSSTVLEFKIDDGEWKKEITSSDCSITTGTMHTLSVRSRKSANSKTEVLTERVSLHFDIEPKELIVSGELGAKDKTYDKKKDAKFDLDDVAIDGIIGNDKVSLKVTGKFADANAGKDIAINVSDIKLAGKDAISYKINIENLVMTSLKANINKRTVTIYPKSGQKKQYGKEDPSSFAYKAELLKGDKLSGKLGREEGEDAGTYKYTLGTLRNPNYKLVLKSGKFEITKLIPEVSIPENLTGYVGEKLSEVVLPKYFKWQEDTTLNQAGTITYLATYTDADSNYETVNDIPISVLVEDKKTTDETIDNEIDKTKKKPSDGLDTSNTDKRIGNIAFSIGVAAIVLFCIFFIIQFFRRNSIKKKA